MLKAKAAVLVKELASVSIQAFVQCHLAPKSADSMLLPSRRKASSAERDMMLRKTHIG